ncbi:hypothetical protein [Paracoccus sp. SSK6]|uniref:hypothetical protein n=1 Tax=Paracoccus sp. SSK6 TaxID=3143131 RepID=UPI0032198191
MDALRAYQHNAAYRALYEKVGESSPTGKAVLSERNFDKAASKLPIMVIPDAFPLFLWTAQDFSTCPRKSPAG